MSRRDAEAVVSVLQVLVTGSGTITAEHAARVMHGLSKIVDALEALDAKSQPTTATKENSNVDG